jgi:hypothetical protein
MNQENVRKAEVCSFHTSFESTLVASHCSDLPRDDPYLSLPISRGFMKLRILSQESELKEYMKSWEGRDVAWRDRENELRRILHVEKDREISQLKAEYDSCIS